MTAIRGMAVTVVTVLALATAFAQQASAHEYNAKTTPITALGENHTFTAGEAIITCKKAEFKYTGKAEKLVKLHVTPAYKECKVLGNTALVTVEKAEFLFGAPTEIKGNEFSMTAAITGETGAKLKVTATISTEKCEVDFPAQSLMGETTKFINNAGKTGGEVQAKIEGVDYKSNSKCDGKVPAEGTEGKYEGTASETGLIVE